MVIMESCSLPENSFNELLQEIERCHYVYLEMEESPKKIEQRNRLEEYIQEFVCLSAHYNKFSFHDTAEVLQLSAAHKKDFSAYKASMGFNAIQLYAGNLLAQPWRKEYRSLKTYCGFYKHQVEANLMGAEKMFEAMGYRYCREGLLVLDAPICPDRVAAVSRDCLIAYVECQILKTIWEEVCTIFKISWLEVLEFRTKYICSPEQSINSLKCKYHQRHYQEHSRSLSQGSNAYPAMRYQTIPVPAPSPIVSMNHSFPPPNNHHHVGLPLQQQDYMMNGCCSRNYPMAYNQAVIGPSYPNRDFIYNVPVPSNNMYVVPTGKLIEVEPNFQSFDVVDHPRSRSQKKTAEPEYNSTSNGIDPKDSQLDDWDYVYRNLEHQGYTKDLGERGDILISNAPKQIKEAKKVKQTNLDEAFNHLSVHERPLKVSDAPRKSQKSPIEASKEAKTKNLPKEKSLTVDKSVQAKTAEKKPKEEKTNKKKPVNKPPSDVTESKKWQCKTCTYLNDTEKEICEMCGKSRQLKDETPIEVGGAECSHCTLVNPKNNKVCEACGKSLAGSPTYI